jgi:hypothetical protein
MRLFKCLACKTCLRSKESEADPIGDLCPVCGSLLEPASWAVELIADSGVGEIIARRELKHARIRPAIKRYDVRSVSQQVQAAASRASGTGEEAVRRRRRAPTTAAPPRVPRVLGAFDDARHRR